MSKNNCMTCLFGDHCVSKRDCEYYSPIDLIDDMTDIELEQYIEDERLQYLHDWWRYINDFE